MKYLKTFERLLYFTDSQVINHPLLGFCVELEKVLKKVKVADNDNKKYKIKKYFNVNGDISIFYNNDNGRNLFKFKILEYDDDVMMIMQVWNRFTNNYNDNSIYLFNFIYDNFKEYISNDYEKTRKCLRFPKNEIDNIVKKLQEIDIYFSAIKYNIF